MSKFDVEAWSRNAGIIQGSNAAARGRCGPAQASTEREDAERRGHRIQERHRDHERVRSEEQQLDGDQRLVKSGHEIVVGVVDRERAVLEIAHRAREVRCQAVPDVDVGKPGQEEDGAKVEPDHQQNQPTNRVGRSHESAPIPGTGAAPS